MFVYWKEDSLIQYTQFALKIKNSSLLGCDCFGNTKTQPVTPALPAFLVLLGEGRHPPIIYTES